MCDFFPLSFLYFVSSCISSDACVFLLGSFKQIKSFSDSMRATYNVINLSEATLELAGAKSASCGRLALLASLSEKGTCTYLGVCTLPQFIWD
jgi:hypothetical protein